MNTHQSHVDVPGGDCCVGDRIDDLFGVFSDPLCVIRIIGGCTYVGTAGINISIGAPAPVSGVTLRGTVRKTPHTQARVLGG